MTNSPSGVAFRDQDVRLDVTADAVLAANRSQRLRLLATLQGLSTDQWRADSRCLGWTVQDVARHLVQVTDLLLLAVDAARSGERFTGFSAFDPRSTPKAMLVAAGEQSLEQTLQAFTDSTERMVREIDRLALGDPGLLVATPAGRQLWHRAALHGLFDSALHERDILVPLSEPVRYDAAEMAAVAGYQFLLTGRILSLAGATVELSVRLDSGPTLQLVVDGPVVDVRDTGAEEKADCSGPATAVLDAMAGRGRLAAVLTGPPEAVAALSVLATVL